MSRLGACVDSTLTWIGNNKLSSFLIVCLFAFIVSTWTLAAINADLNRRLDEKNNQIDPATTTTPAIQTTLTTTKAPVVTTTTEEPATTPDSGPTNLRLREDVKPILYDLLLHPDLQTGHFTGNVKIDLNITSSINDFAIHTHLLNVSSVKFTLSGSNVAVKSYEHDAKLEQLKIYLTTSVGPTEYSVLEIEFSGSLNDKIVGFYRSVYRDSEGNGRYIATSKFEPTFARQSFPCFGM
ncbi:uncharacterized protein [Chironomus tepperi]|uniref:uncharacterized protein n=1 Tax=Chironomus tepperi TaxID=113505 RepID=UPI00391F379D